MRHVTPTEQPGSASETLLVYFQPAIQRFRKVLADLTDRGLFLAQGFLLMPGLVPRAEVEKMRRRLDELCEDWEGPEAQRLLVGHEADAGGVSPRSKATVRRFRYLSAYEPVFRAHSLSTRITKVVQDLIGSPISLYSDQAILKPARLGSEKPPHQDNAYFGVHPPEHLVTCWCPVDRATVENGCLHYVPGSHAVGLLDHRQIAGTPHLTPRSDLGDLVPVPAEPGDCILHHSLVLHSSPSNSTETWRRAIAAHYVRSDANYRVSRHQPPIPIPAQ